ncbi:CAP domain-containing protein [uncultured Brevibacillus sp.]|uniref:CAP domain-containing protein n=1 Tax=uncultured Brevibacillus sp. TaxID=169970 RepID=UPI002595AF9F|nr:CAP domain-containing protein [uncultured Brevibacillus sp.]
MKRLGTIAIATMGLGFVLSGFSNTASAATTYPQYGYQPYMQPVQPQMQVPYAAPANQQQPVKQAKQQVDASTVGKQVTDLVNQERAKAGLKPVELDASLNKVAQAKAADMSSNNYFDHTSPTYGSPFDMMKQFGVSYMTTGENIAMGQRTAREVMNQWMNSEGHRQNIMNPSFTKIGVGFVNGYWVQEFIG